MQLHFGEVTVENCLDGEKESLTSGGGEDGAACGGC